MFQISPARPARKSKHAVRPSPPAVQLYNSNVRLIEVAPTSVGCFSASSNRELLVISSRVPFLDAARVLQSRGVDSNSWLIGRHAGSGTEAVRGKVGVLARLTVEDRPSGGKPPRFIRHRPMPDRAEGSAPVARRDFVCAEAVGA